MIKLKPLIESYDFYHSRPIMWTREEAQPIADKIGAVIVGSVAEKGSSKHDLDLRVEKYDDSIRDTLKSLGFEWEGSHVVSPAEAKKSKKNFGKGWQRAEYFQDSKLRNLEVWHDDNEILRESSEKFLQGKTLLSVDIQPLYEKFIGFKTNQYCSFLNENYDSLNQLVFLYNGADTIGGMDESQYKYWLMENGLDELIVDQARFYDKGYGYFRYCLDQGADVDATANFVRFLYENDVRDSRDMTRDLWAKYLRQHRKLDRTEIYDLLKHEQDNIYVTELMDELKRYNNVVVTGGGVEACLREVIVALKALGKPYDTLKEFTYW